MRHLRRDLVSLYTANVLAWQTGPMALWYLQGVPRANALRALVARALEHFLPSIMNHMKEQVYCYSGTILRCDGNFDLATRIAAPQRREDGTLLRWVRPYSVLYGVCLIDGALADIPAPMAVENMRGILPVLRRLVRDIMEARTAAGLGQQASAVVAHATDTYQKHRQRLNHIYADMNCAVNVVAVAATPKGYASRATAKDQVVTRITGDPAHDLFAFQRTVSPSANDSRDLRSDHKDIMAPLSIEMPSRTRNVPKEPKEFQGGLTHCSSPRLQNPCQISRRR